MRDLLNILEKAGFIGVEHLGALKAAMADSVALLSTMVADLQTKGLLGHSIDPGILATLINARRREAEAIGIDPQILDATPSLAEYIKRKAAA